MKRSFIFSFPQVQKGAVAVEAALCMSFVLVPLLLGVLLLGKFFWVYTATQKAVHDAAIYMASAPLSEIKSNGASTLAMDIMEKETSDFDKDIIASPSALCGYKFSITSTIIYRACDTIFTPVSMQTSILLSITNPFFSPLSSAGGGASTDSIQIMAYSQIVYVGI